MVNEAGDHFLTGSGFARQQNRGFCLSDTCRLREHVFPALRHADHAMVASAVRLELTCQSGDLRPWGGRRLARFRIASCRVSKVLIRKRQSEMVRDTPSKVHVLVSEAIRCTRKKKKPPE